MGPEEPPGSGVEVEVGRLVRGRLDPAELLRGEALDPGRRGSARQLRGELRVLSAQVGALTTEAVELHVEAEHRDIGRDHAREQRRDDSDPERSPGHPVLTLCDAWSRSQRGGCLLGPGGGPGSHGLSLDSYTE